MKFYYSDVVHDVIGNHPVLDQFDLEKTSEYYGSSQDDFVTGSLLALDVEASRRSGKITYIESNRGKLFSKLDANIQPALDSTYNSAEVSKNSSYAARLIPWTEKVSNSYKITQCIDEKERFYDSCLPDISSCFAANDSFPWTTSDDPKYWLSPQGNIKTSNNGFLLFNAAPIVVDKKLSDNLWTWSFPYESRYKNIKRLMDSKEILKKITTSLSTNWYPKSFIETKTKQSTINSFYPLLPGKKNISTSDTSFRSDPFLPDDSIGSYRILIPSDIDLSQKNSVNNELLTGTLVNDDMIKFLFGFGDLNNITYTSYTLNEDEEDRNEIISSSYFTGFELQNWSIPSAFAVLTIPSSSFNGSPILQSGSAPTYFNAQFDQPTGDVIVKWVAPSASFGLSDGYNAQISYYFTTTAGATTTTTLLGVTEAQMGFAGSTGWKEYPWVLVAREGALTSSIGEFGESQIYNYVSQSSYYSYPSGNTSSARGRILTGSSAVYWLSSSSPSRHWVLGSFLSTSIGPTINDYPEAGNTSYVTFVYKTPDPKFEGEKIISSQKMDLTSSYPWKLSYQRAVSAHVSDYFRSSFSGMPGFPSSLGNVDIEIERLNGTDVPFEGTGNIETTPQVLTDFTSSLYPPGEYQVKFSYVKTGITGSTNGVDRAFIDNVNILTFDQNQLTATYDPNSRLGYSHYPEFRQYIRDTRTSPYFPGTGFRTNDKLYRRQRTNPRIVSDTSDFIKSNEYGNYEFGISPVIRGWKYGISNGLPEHSKAVYRSNRYGQFRDMLEQRPFTKYINVEKSILSDPSGNASLTSMSRSTTTGIQTGPVTVRFVKQTAKVDVNNLGKIVLENVDPSTTDSQNLSSESTSEIPYFDGETRNRQNDYNPDGTLKSRDNLVVVTAQTPEFTINSAAKILPSISNLVISSQKLT